MLEDTFEYQIKRIVKEIREENELEDLSSEQLQDEIWNDENLLKSFGRKIIERCNEYSGNEIFE